ncbi:MAG: hypothetical protein COW63_13850, partial [Bacteroidetes bacterium CG18_big_fil_WC_8_21_14_2_50_41_14]
SFLFSYHSTSFFLINRLNDKEKGFFFRYEIKIPNESSLNYEIAISGFRLMKLSQQSLAFT